MAGKRIGRHVGGGEEPAEERAERERREAFREALSNWATGVSILAVREGGVHALTVGSFIPVSIDPPLVLASLGANASALPYLERGTEFVVSVLAGDQSGLAARYADTFPVGPSPFPERGPPRVRGSLAALVCEVEEMLVRGDHTLVIGRVLEAEGAGERAGEREGMPALAYFRRRYHTLE